MVSQSLGVQVVATGVQRLDLCWVVIQGWPFRRRRGLGGGSCFLFFYFFIFNIIIYLTCKLAEQSLTVQSSVFVWLLRSGLLGVPVDVLFRSGARAGPGGSDNVWQESGHAPLPC